MSIAPIGKYRWIVVVLLFFATTINYLDRYVMGLIKPYIEKRFNWTETDYSHIVIAFSSAYALGLLLSGRFIDLVGTKLGYALSIVIWSCAAMAHALVTTTLGFTAARAMLGFGESGNFPSAVRAVTEWFPKKERALATGIFNSGTNIGAVVAPAAVPWIAITYGWQQAFVWTGAIGFLWLICWLIFFHLPAKTRKLSQAEYAYIHSDDISEAGPNPKVSWIKLFTVRQTWAFVFGKFLTDPIWWFFLFWLPSYFSSSYHLNLQRIGLPIIIIYTSSTIGSIGGGWFSSWLIKEGWAVFRARKTAMLLFALGIVPVVFIQYINNLWLIVGMISLAAACHQAWSANIFTTASDMFPKNAISSIVGIGGMAGSVGGILFPILVGILLDHYKLAGNITNGYNILFVICGCAYLVAWWVMHIFSPRMEPVSPASIS
jgi:MFS transporter, ACS family, hexuronate transporter